MQWTAVKPHNSSCSQKGKPQPRLQYTLAYGAAVLESHSFTWQGNISQRLLSLAVNPHSPTSVSLNNGRPSKQSWQRLNIVTQEQASTPPSPNVPCEPEGAVQCLLHSALLPVSSSRAGAVPCRRSLQSAQLACTSKVHEQRFLRLKSPETCAECTRHDVLYI